MLLLSDFHIILQVPALAIYGSNEHAFVPNIGELMREHVDKYSVQYIEGASHWVQQDEPEQVNKCIRDFLTYQRAER